jgi:hypothetical protein
MILAIEKLSVLEICQFACYWVCLQTQQGCDAGMLFLSSLVELNITFRVPQVASSPFFQATFTILLIPSFQTWPFLPGASIVAWEGMPNKFHAVPSISPFGSSSRDSDHGKMYSNHDN